ncbi:Gfo/Idh/MocA family protein [Tamaricihabitans halophyticus]|nr:Gfo/Idh/MocA family oxidoreductase [Tamaricihabitans halophyticus]
MRIGFAGLAHSHPFTDAGVARSEGVEDIVVCSTEPDRLAMFQQQYDCHVVHSLAELLAAGPDVVIVTARPGKATALIEGVLAAGVPCFANKVVAANEVQLEELDRVVSGHPGRFCTSSVLRFSPAVVELKAQLSEPALLVRATVRHDISAFLRPERAWQDDPQQGGGTLVSVGLHGVELLDAVLGEGARTVSALRASHVHPTNSEDTGAVLLRWPTGALGSIELVGAGTEHYAISAQTATQELHHALAGPDKLTALGYRDAMRAILRMAEGEPAPVPWQRSREVLRAVLEAAKLARS